MVEWSFVHIHTDDLLVFVLPFVLSALAQWVAVFTLIQTAWPLKARGLPDDGVAETSAMEVQMVALGTLYPVEAEKYDFNLSKLY